MINIGQDVPTAISTFAGVASYSEALGLFGPDRCGIGLRYHKPDDPGWVHIADWETAYGVVHPSAYKSSIPPLNIDMAAWRALNLHERKRLLAFPKERRASIIALPSQVWPDAAPAPVPVPHPVVVLHPVPLPEPEPEPEPEPPPEPPPVPLVTGRTAPPGLPWKVGTYEEAKGLIKTGCGGGFTRPDMVFKRYGWTTAERHEAGLAPLYIPTYLWESVFGYPHERAHLSLSPPRGLGIQHWKPLTEQQRADLLKYPIEQRRSIAEAWLRVAPPPAPEPQLTYFPRTPAVPPPAAARGEYTHVPGSPALTTAPGQPPPPVPAPMPATVAPVVDIRPTVGPVPPAVAAMVAPVSTRFEPFSAPSVFPYIEPAISSYLPQTIPLPLPPTPEEMEIYTMEEPVGDEKGPRWVLYGALAALAYYAFK